MEIGLKYMIDFHVVSSVAKTYNPLDYVKNLCDYLGQLYPEVNFYGRPKNELHKLISDALFEYYNGEHRLKYYLFNHFYSKKVVCGFEIKVNRSRVDFLAVNGKSSSFEIKSSLDNLDKLEKQSSDFVKAFEYNYVVIDEVHLERACKILPHSYGIWSFKGGYRKTHRTASLNKELDANIQLGLLSKAELRAYFQGFTSSQEILNKFKSSVINNTFKEILRGRYEKRWKFLVDNKEEILPIDIQFFYNKNIPPSQIYS